MMQNKKSNSSPTFPEAEDKVFATVQHRRPRGFMGDSAIDEAITQLLKAADLEEPNEFYREIIANAIKLGKNKPQRGDLKLISRALTEMRVADRVFSKYRDTKKVAVFGSARTRSERQEYIAAKQFGQMMVESNYMVVTGGGEGIMGAAQIGAGREKSFGLNIILPFEQEANETIQNDPKLVTFKYFFTRKLTFVKESHAVVCFPGGFGTMDEAFETLTLIQTGKARIVPLLFVDATGGNFWSAFVHYISDHLLHNGLISKEDFHLFKVTDSLEEAREEICHFYKNFHSYRFVKDDLVVRMQRVIPEAEIAKLNDEFKDIIFNGKIRSCEAYADEANEPEILTLPRVTFPFNRRAFGRFRQLINRINDY
ncbi:MAG: TIGR00730 family Rossman fold protein [Verrucomicrobiia bacterium]